MRQSGFEEEKKMRVVTFNTWGVPLRLAHRTRRACIELRALNPDVVCLQEVAFAEARRIICQEMEADYIVLGADETAGYSYPWSGYIPSAVFGLTAVLSCNSLGTMLWWGLMAWALIPASVYGLIAWGTGGPIDRQGLVMLLRRSKFQDRGLSHWRKPFAVQGYACRIWNPLRWWVETTFLCPGLQKVQTDDGLVIVNSHLVVGTHADRSSQITEIQMSSLVAAERFIWAGDMNAGYTEMCRDVDIDGIRCCTAPGATSGNENIDMIWCDAGARPGPAVCCIGEADNEISDHCGVVVDFKH
jgi:endonuclease/exonuclease/phosphatase family metal-dependent hydrolase